ncbi:hypothetical protein [Bosea sp. R86505]|uniref:hypothetical protein n=1 Tax=Bosea sp. R86505 TaxID=3101710 RepID=UPI00367231D7
MKTDANHVTDLSAEGRDMLRLLLEPQRPPTDFGRAHKPGGAHQPATRFLPIATPSALSSA